MMTLRHAVAGLLLYTVILPGSKHRWIQESRWAYLLFRLTVYCVLRLNGAPREQVIWQLQRLDELEEEGVTDDEAQRTLHQEGKWKPWRRRPPRR